MQYRLALVLAVLSASAAIASAQVSSTTIRYASGSGRSGYDSASFRARYALHACQGTLVITTELAAGSFQWSDTYWLDGKQYSAPAGLTPTVRDQGTFNGTVRVRGGGDLGSFRSTAGLNSHGCLGDTSRIVNLAGYVDINDKAAVEKFIASLEVVPDVNPPYINPNIENAVRRQLADDKKKADDAQKKAEDDKRKADEEARRRAEADARAEEERKRKADEELRRIKEGERKRQDDADKKARDDHASAQAEEERKAQEEDARKAREESARIAKENAAAKAKLDAEAQARADEDAAKEAKRKADDDAARAKTEWTDQDNSNGGYWPEERCYWIDSKGFVHPPPGRNNCDPVFIRQILAAEKRQFEMELNRIEAEAREEQARRNLQAYAGNTTEGALAVGVGAALAPLADAMGEGTRRLNEGFPKTLDLETNGRVVLGTGTGYGFSIRAPGFFYVHMGYVSYDTGSFDRARGYTFGVGIQLPLTRRFTLRVIEAGVTVGAVQHVVDETAFTGGGNARLGVLIRLVKGLAFTATVGADTTGGTHAFTDFGLAWRFDLSKTGEYMLQ